MSSLTKPLRLGTRASPLAMAQAVLVRDALCAVHGWADEAIEIVPIVASGDKILDRALADVGGKALWTRELDAWLGEGAIDFAVHSMKDVETIRPKAFSIAAMLPRADVRDRLLGAASIAEIPKDGRVGTSAPRRTAQMLRMRPDLEITLFRGNVNTRLAKLANGDVAATLLAAAGLDRLGMDDVGIPIAIDIMLPAPSQAAVGIECLTSNSSVMALLGAINHPETHVCVTAERALLGALSADCRSPVAALAVIDADEIWLRAEIYAEDGSEMVQGESRFAVNERGKAEALAKTLLAKASPQLRATFG